MTAENEVLRKDYEGLQNGNNMKIHELFEKILTLEDEVRKRVVERDNAEIAQRKLQEELERSRADLEVASSNADSYARSLETSRAEKSQLQATFDTLKSFLNAEGASK